MKTFLFTVGSWSNPKTCPTWYKIKKTGVIWHYQFDWLAERGKTVLIGLFMVMTGTVARQSVKFTNYNIYWNHAHPWWWKRANYPAHLLLSLNWTHQPCLEGQTWLAVWFCEDNRGWKAVKRQADVCGAKRHVYVFVEACVWPPCSGVDLGKSSLVESQDSTSLNISRWFLWKPHVLQKDECMPRKPQFLFSLEKGHFFIFL